MAQRYIGDAVIRIEYVGGPDDEYQGAVHADGRTWYFTDLYPPRVGFAVAYDSPEAYDEMAASAVGFASYYASSNRGDDVPDWAPDEETADAIEEATQWAVDETGEFEVGRPEDEDSDKDGDDEELDADDEDDLDEVRR